MSTQKQQVSKLAALKRAKAEMEYYSIAAHLKRVDERINRCISERSKRVENQKSEAWRMAINQKYHTFLTAQISDLRDERTVVLEKYESARRNLQFARHSETIISEMK